MISAGTGSGLLRSQLLSWRFSWSQVHHEPNLQSNCQLLIWRTKGSWRMRRMASQALSLSQEITWGVVMASLLPHRIAFSSKKRIAPGNLSGESGCFPFAEGT